MLWLGRAERDVEDEVFLRSPNRKITGRRRSGLVGWRDWCPVAHGLQEGGRKSCRRATILTVLIYEISLAAA